MGLTRPRAHQLQGSDYKQSVRALSSTNVTLNGGAPATLDGVELVASDRILVTGQTDASQNGLYKVQTAGSGSNGTWVRTQDGDSAGDITAGMTVMVTEGTTNGDTQWKLTTDDPITIGTTGLNFEQASAYSFGKISVGGTTLVADKVNDTVTISAGNNISLTGNASTDTFTVSVSDSPSFNDISFNNATVTGNIIPSANVTYNLGSATQRWNDLFLAGNTIDLGGTKVSVTGTGDVEFKDASNNPKKIIASEIELGTGASKVKLKRGADGKFQFTDESDTKTAADLAQNDTDDLGEGSTNLYYTDARVSSHLASFGSNNISTTGTITANGVSLTNLNASNITNGTIPDARIQSSGVTQHQADLSITESQISDLGSYITASSTDTLTNKIIDATQLTGTIADARIANTSITQHQADLSITESQISDLQSYLTSETVTSISFATNTLSYIDENGSTTDIDLSLYLDDTNLARLTSGTVAANGIATFSRDDASTFTVDFSALFDDTNLSRITSASFADSTGILTLTRDDTSTVTANLDGRYLTDYTVTSDDVTAHQSNLSITESQISDLGAYITASSSDTLTNKSIDASQLTGTVANTRLTGSYSISVDSATTAGTVTTAAQPNITSVGTLTSLTTSGNVEVQGQNQIRLFDSDSSHYVSLRSSATVSANVTWTLPNSDGTDGQVLTTNGGGVLSFEDVSGGGASGSSYPNSTISFLPGSDGNYDLSKTPAQTTSETPFESGVTDPFGVNLGSVFSMMDPIGSIQTAADGEGGVDLGVLT